MTTDDIRARSRLAAAGRARLDPVHAAIERVLVGQRPLVDRILIGLLTGGHLLLEGMPGLAKTLAVRAVAQTLNLSFQRIQFTPDLLPADILGTQVFHAATGEFSIKRGPIFSQIVLADEINRAPAKVQSALLEAMQERQVTLGETTFPLPEPFQVLATQNPIEHEGTYPLPEAQLDRFMFKVLVRYPNRTDELAILDRMAPIRPELTVAAVLSAADLAELREGVDGIFVDDAIKHYILDIVHATRKPGDPRLDLGSMIEYGASPRAALFLVRGAKGVAFLHGRGYVLPEDVKAVAADVLRHRIIVSFEAEAQETTSDSLIETILSRLPVP